MGIKINFRRGWAVALLLFTFCFTSAFAQKDGKADFNAAVDQINCETMKFIHREEGRKSVADKMECFTFESIYKSIPEDEISSTGKLCKDINHTKDKYNPKEDLGKQLDLVIAMAYGKITKKKRKGDIEEYKTKLEEYKKEAIESFNQVSAPTAAAKPDPKHDAAATADKPKPDSPAVAVKPEPAKNNASNEILPVDKPKSENNSGIVSWAALILSLIAMAISAFGLLRLKHFIDETEARRDEPTPELTRPSAPLVRESPDNYKLLEMKFNDELRSMRAYFEGKIAELSASQKEAKAEEIQFASSTVIDEGHYVPEEDNKEEVIPETPEPEHTNEFSPPVQATLFGETIGTEIPSKHFEEELDTNLLPSYRFAALPEGGVFDDTLFTESASADSIFEIESYSDVPGRAFFSILNYAEVVSKVIADPATYLEPFCIYEGSPEGISRIILLDEGILQQENNKWRVTTKAHVKFE